MLAEFNWSDLVDKLPAILAITFLFGGWVIAAAIGSIMTNWRKVREAEQMAALKQSMVDKGLSAADIEKILNAGNTKKA